MLAERSVSRRPGAHEQLLRLPIGLFLLVGMGLAGIGCDSETSSGDCETPPCGPDTSGLYPSAPPQYQYAGGRADAEWRGEARERIKDHRMDSLRVTVVDAEGTSVDGATVRIEMQKHAFNFGTAVNDRLIDQGGNSYREALRSNFNYATIENGLKYYNWADDPDRQQSARSAVQWLNDNGYAVRGHAAFWEEWWWMEIDESQLAPEIHKDMKNKIRDRLEEFEGQMLDWDAQNHPFHRSAIRAKVANGTDMTEQEAVAEWWATANEADQEARMGINEQNILQKYPCCDFEDQYARWIDGLMSMGVEVEAIGFMGHANINRLEGISQVLDILDRFAQFDVPLYVSEFHITLENWNDENTTWADATQAEKDAQAAYLRDFLTAFFSHPAADTFVHWTFWEGQAWRRTSALYGPDWTLRDHSRMYRKLVFDRWWTDVEGKTDEGGTYSTNAFKGTHRIEVEKGNRSGLVTTTLPDGGASVEIAID